MDPGQGMSAAELVAGIDEKELARVIWVYGEDRDSRRIARGVVRAREEAPILTTARLAEVVSRAKGGRRGRIHPATQTFQALRIEVNQELEHVTSGVEAAVRTVRAGGRVVVISFHSLEDRIVKRTFAVHEGRRESLAAGGDRWVGELPALSRVWRKPRTADSEESEQNPRARSAKVRAVERKA
jgi:16S rRNA (cytosine1402-N4)-methyltransferase